MSAPHHALDAALTRLAIARDPDAWARIVAQAGPELHRLALRLTGDAALADDAVQDALIQVRDGAGRYRARHDPDRDAWGWIMRVGINAALMRVRRRAVQRRREVAPVETLAPAAADAVEQAELRTVLRGALAVLPEAQRAAVVLHCVDGQPLETVAVALGCPLGTAKSWVHRGLGRLRRQLSPLAGALSLTAVAGLLGRLDAASVAFDATRAGALLSAPPAASLAALPSLGMSMSLKIALPIAAALVVATPLWLVATAAESPPADATAASEVPVAVARREHVVAAGETIASISRLHLGSATRWPEMRAANPGVDVVTGLQAGMKLVIPEPPLPTGEIWSVSDAVAAAGVQAHIADGVRVNVRSAPGTQHRLLMVVPPKTPIAVLGRATASGWLAVRLPDPLPLWIQRDALERQIGGTWRVVRTDAVARADATPAEMLFHRCPVGAILDVQPRTIGDCQSVRIPGVVGYIAAKHVALPHGSDVEQMRLWTDAESSRFAELETSIRAAREQLLQPAVQPAVQPDNGVLVTEAVRWPVALDATAAIALATVLRQAAHMDEQSLRIDEKTAMLYVRGTSAQIVHVRLLACLAAPITVQFSENTLADALVAIQRMTSMWEAIRIEGPAGIGDTVLTLNMQAQPARAVLEHLASLVGGRLICELPAVRIVVP